MAKDRRIGPFYHARRVCAGVLVLGLLGCAMGANPPRGAGPPLQQPETLRLLEDGRLLVADARQGVLTVDPDTGDRTLIHAAAGLQDAVPSAGGYALADAAQGKVSWLNPRGRVVDLATVPGATRLAAMPDGSLAVLAEGRLLHLQEGRLQQVPVSLHEPADLEPSGPTTVLVPEETMGRLREVDLARGVVTRTWDLQDDLGPPVLEPGGVGPGSEPGEVLLADTLTAEVTALDLATGRRRTVSQPGTGSGVLLPQVQDAVATPPDVAVLYPRKGAVVRVSPEQLRTVLSGPALPGGRQRMQPLGVAVLQDGTTAVLDWATRRVVLLDPAASGIPEQLDVPIALAASGQRLFVYDRRRGVLEVGTGQVLVQPAGLGMALAADGERLYAAALSPDHVLEIPLDGSEPRALDLEFAPAGVAVEPGGSLLLTDFEGGAVVRVPGGPVRQLRRPWALAVDPSGRAVVGDNDQEALVDVATGRVLTRTGHPPGPPLQGVQALAFTRDGALLVADPGGGGLLRVDLATGARAPVDAGSP